MLVMNNSTQYTQQQIHNLLKFIFVFIYAFSICDVKNITGIKEKTVKLVIVYEFIQLSKKMFKGLT